MTDCTQTLGVGLSYRLDVVYIKTSYIMDILSLESDTYIIRFKFRNDGSVFETRYHRTDINNLIDSGKWKISLMTHFDEDLFVV